VAALRDKGYVQGEIVEKILGLRLGITDREIRAVDRTLRRDGESASAPAPPSASPTNPPAPSPGTRTPSRPSHAGLRGDEGLHQR
jgi:hypothetical protein